MLRSFRFRLFAVVTFLVLAAALSIAFYQQIQIEGHIARTELLHAQNLLKMATVHIENQYESYLFFKNSLLEERKRDLANNTELIFTQIRHWYQRFEGGELTESEVKERVKNYVRSLRYGNNDSGYFWINDCGKPHPLIIAHPTMPEIEGEAMDSADPLFNSVIGENPNLFQSVVNAVESDGAGYVEYWWAKPINGKLSENKHKLSFVRLFEPWDWIIGTGVYIDDIEHDSQKRVNAIIKELRNAFAKVVIGKNSYMFIFDGKYNVLVHPVYHQTNLGDEAKTPAEKAIIDKFMAYNRESEKPISYHWKRPGEPSGKDYLKHAFISYFKPFDWYIVTSIYKEELRGPLNGLRWKLLALTTILLSLSLILASMLTKTLSRPLQKLAEAAQNLESDGLHDFEFPVAGASETQSLGNCLNSMLQGIRAAHEERDILFKKIRDNEEKNRLILNSIAEAVIATDSSGRVLSMNPMAEQLTGYSKIESTGKLLPEIYPAKYPDIEDDSNTTLNRIINIKETTVADNLLLINRTGDELHVSESRSPIFDETGQLAGAVLVFRNITESYNYQQQLKEAEWKFKALFENGPLGVAYHRMIYDDSGEPVDYYFIDANKNYQKLTGVNPIGKTVRKAFPGIENDTFNWIETFGKVARTGEATRFQQFLKANDRYYDCVAFQYKPDHFVAAFMEITEQVKLEQQLRHAQKMDAIGQLAGGIAHDFNNVLGGILGAAELLSMELSSNKNANQYLAIIQDASERASDLVRKLLAFGRQNTLVSTPVDSQTALNEAIALLKVSVDKKVSVESNLEAENTMVIGDLSQLQNVFLNLGINASHAMPNGGKIIIESKNIRLDEIGSNAYGLEPGHYVKFEFRDTGCGIPPANLNKIFEPFFTTKEKGKGTGLGLAAAFGVVKQHRGSINVYSEVGVGTVFHVLLPLTDLRKIAKKEQQAPVKGEGLILVIDDESIIRSTASAILTQLGYEVLTAENGEEGFNVFAQNRGKIKLVILDMIMPIMNGRECFEKIIGLAPEARIILASGFSKEDDLQHMKKKGLRGFIHKPFSVSELSNIIEKTLS